jgi:hypothetical protein
MAVAGAVTEAVLLGITSGPVCLASCSPVLLPVLAAERRPALGTASLLAQFLAGRLAGYLGFACLAWMLGITLALEPRARALAFGFADLGIAVLLAVYAVALREKTEKTCEQGCPAARARLSAARYRSFAPLYLGLASGLALCPPFVAAGVRAAEVPGLAQALLFFCGFFVGTSIWFVPSLGVGLLHRFAAVGTVARLTLFLLAAYYGYLALIVLGRVFLHA